MYGVGCLDKKLVMIIKSKTMGRTFGMKIENSSEQNKEGRKVKYLTCV